MQAGGQIVAYFDFDGTLTTQDTFLPFLIFIVGWFKFILILPRLIPIGIRYALRRITNEQAKELTLSVVLRGYKKIELTEYAKHFALTKLNKYLKPAIYAKLEWHREHGHTLILISANLGIYLRPWAILHKLNYVIATEIKFSETGIATGKLLTKNCYGVEKVVRIKEFLAENFFNFSYSYAYGNSAGDYQLLNYVHEPFLVDGNTIEPWVKNG